MPAREGVANVDEFKYDISYIERFDFYWITYCGNPDLAEFSGVNSELVRHPNFAASKDLLLDMRQASLVNITNDDFKRIRLYMGRLKDREKRKQAAIVRNQLDYGLHRMFTSQLSDAVLEQRKVFEGVEDALSWLRPDDLVAMRTDLALRY